MHMKSAMIPRTKIVQPATSMRWRTVKLFALKLGMPQDRRFAGQMGSIPGAAAPDEVGVLESAKAGRIGSIEPRVEGTLLACEFDKYPVGCIGADWRT